MIKYTPIPLNEGLDTVTPPVMKEGGSLIDCLNYEMTGEFGYRRIDGYERYDGWVGGEIANYYRVTVNDGGIGGLLVPGATLVYKENNTAIVAAIVVNYAAGVLTYVSVNPDYQLFPSGTPIDVSESEVLIGGRVVTTAAAVSGVMADAPATFVANLRAYAATLRALIPTNLTPVCGIHVFRNQPIIALNCPIMVSFITDPAERALIVEGGYLRHNGIIYRIIKKAVSSNQVTLHLEPILTSVVNSSIQLVNKDQVVYATLATASAPTITYDESDEAYLVTYRTPATSTARGVTTLQRSIHLRFTNAGTAAQPVFAEGNLLAVGTSSSEYFTGIVNSVVLQSGTYAAGTAAGWIELNDPIGLAASAFGNKPYADTASDILSFGGSTKLADIAEVMLSRIAGSRQLRAKRTRYQWMTANFFGQEDTTRAYGVTGTSRGFWANAYQPDKTTQLPANVISADAFLLASWGNIRTQAFEGRDVPKYLALHSQVQLAFGFEGGSVLFSVVGEPSNFEGSQGAMEIATGDQLTGLIEQAGDSLIVFGKRTIRRITGTSDADAQVQMISNKSGCLDYTAAAVGGAVLFAAPNGISTLDQSEAYGDFEGQRVTYKISNTLPVKLVTDRSDSETGGAAMALTVRAKDQYRLWLKTGEVIVVTMTSEGPKITSSNYGAQWSGANDIRVPFAWSSDLIDSQKEFVLVAWDRKLAERYANIVGVLSANLPEPKQVYALERGWGFDGARFPGNFDVAHVFQDVGTHLTTIKKVRIHGLSYGIATLNLKTAGVIRPDFFDQAYHSRIQDISLPRNLRLFSADPRPVTSIVDTAIEGLGIKLGFYATQLTPTETEPSHTIQVLVCEADEGGQQDG